MSHRATTPEAVVLTPVASLRRPVPITRQRPVDLVASPRLRGGWQTDGDSVLRLVWRFEAAA